MNVKKQMYLYLFIVSLLGYCDYYIVGKVGVIYGYLVTAIPPIIILTVVGLKMKVLQFPHKRIIITTICSSIASLLWFQQLGLDAGFVGIISVLLCSQFIVLNLPTLNWKSIISGSASLCLNISIVMNQDGLFPIFAILAGVLYGLSHLTIYEDNRSPINNGLYSLVISSIIMLTRTLNDTPEKIGEIEATTIFVILGAIILVIIQTVMSKEISQKGVPEEIAPIRNLEIIFYLPYSTGIVDIISIAITTITFIINRKSV